MKNLLITLSMLFLTVTVWAQGTITGTVLDESGEALIGASVYVKGKENVGTATDIDGKYTIEVFFNSLRLKSRE